MSAVPFYAKRFISGTEMQEGVAAAQSLNTKKISATLDLLGENITSKQQASDCASEYVKLLQLIKQKSIDAHVSIKLTMLGLDIDPEFCYENLSLVLKEADATQNRVALDMEGTPYTERTIAMYERAAKEFKSPEIVLQAYLKRTEKDIQRVLESNGRLRLCKGAYKESAEHAFQNMDDIRENYKKCVSILLLKGKRVAIASHDDKVIQFCETFIKENNIPQDRYEFQMLYGLRPNTWNELRARGHNMTIYVPYGRDWMPYMLRRLAERKENVFFVLKNFFKS